jgi:uncharacterized protein (TIGR03437 family)
VLFNGFPAPLISVDSTDIACMVPFELTGPSIANVQVVVNGVATAAVAVGVKPVAYEPTVLIVINQNGTFNSPSSPAHPGQTVVIYATGFGGTNPQVPDGSLYKSPFPTPIYSVNSLQTITYAGPAPGLIAGVWQINVVLSATATTGQIFLNSAYMSQDAAAMVYVVP